MNLNNRFIWEEKIINERDITNILAEKLETHQAISKGDLMIILNILDNIMTEKMLFWMIENTETAKKYVELNLPNQKMNSITLQIL